MAWRWPEKHLPNFSCILVVSLFGVACMVVLIQVSPPCDYSAVYMKPIFEDC